MTVVFNGTAVELSAGCSVGELVRARADVQRRVAVARNGEVVPRGEWDSTELSDGDLIEVLAPVAGG